MKLFIVYYVVIYVTSHNHSWLVHSSLHPNNIFVLFRQPVAASNICQQGAFSHWPSSAGHHGSSGRLEKTMCGVEFLLNNISDNSRRQRASLFTAQGSIFLFTTFQTWNEKWLLIEYMGQLFLWRISDLLAQACLSLRGVVSSNTLAGQSLWKDWYHNKLNQLGSCLQNREE